MAIDKRIHAGGHIWSITESRGQAYVTKEVIVELDSDGFWVKSREWFPFGAAKVGFWFSKDAAQAVLDRGGVVCYE